MTGRTAARTVGITGASGLIGWHLRCRLFPVPDDFRVVTADRSTFASPQLLESFVKQCDVIVHLAGMNRGDPGDLEHVNVSLAEALLTALESSGRKCHLIFSSSTHAHGDSPYGRSKHKASQLFAAWAGRTGNRFVNLILPHVFGECGRPFYNSVVSTFCYQVANGDNPTVDHDGPLELIHAQDVAAQILSIVELAKCGDIRPEGRRMSVSDMLRSLRAISGSYGTGVIPDLRDAFSLQLFNTYRSYLYPHKYPVVLQLRSDARGSLFEAVKTLHGGQAFLSSTKPGATRGEHFHFCKLERFLVVRGEALIRIRRLYDDQIREFPVSGKTPVFVDMPTLHTHNITNTGDSELLTLFWSHEIFDTKQPDTHHEPVANGKTLR